MYIYNIQKDMAMYKYMYICIKNNIYYECTHRIEMLAEFQFSIASTIEPFWTGQGICTHKRREENAYSHSRHIQKLPLAAEFLCAFLLREGQHKILFVQSKVLFFSRHTSTWHKNRKHIRKYKHRCNNMCLPYRLRFANVSVSVVLYISLRTVQKLDLCIK